MPLGNDLLRTITRLDRDRLEKLIIVAIEYLDNLDGDPESEDDDPDEEHDGGEEQYHQAPDYGVDQTNISACPW